MNRIFQQTLPALILGIFFSMTAHAQVTINSQYVRATIPGTNVSSAYMEIINDSEHSITLVGASAKVSDKVEIHEHVMSNGMMKMQKRDSLEVPAKSKVVLQPSGYHLMIFNLDERLNDGDEVKISLQFKEQPAKEVVFPVTSIKREKAAHHHHH
ncbi:copper chaperone PCu(A)C [Thalassotalea fusca]